MAAKMGLGLSIQERLLQLPLYTDNKLRSVTHLVSNYRSNEALLAIPSNLFYNGKLEALAPESVANPFQDFGDMGEAGFPLLLCDIPHGEERSKLDTPSFFNLDECHAIASLAKGILNCKSKDKINPLHTGEISVITPFRAQVLALRTVLRGANLGGINVGVVEDFQGQEAFIAEPEKALADYLYFVAIGQKVLNERLELKEINKKKLIKYAKLFGRRGLLKLINQIYAKNRRNREIIY